MSYTSVVKQELSSVTGSARHCRVAEIAAMISMCGNILLSPSGRVAVKVTTENIDVARKFHLLLLKTFNVYADISCRSGSGSAGSRVYVVAVRGHDDAVRILSATKIMDHERDVLDDLKLMNNLVIMKDCCKRAFVRGAFLSTGSIADPRKSYHFEIACSSEGKAGQLVKILENFRIEAKTVARKGYYVVYIKDSESIADVLNVMGAHVALLEFENVRILKDMSNYYNREVNCETANIKKTVATASRQIDAIRYIEKNAGLDCLPENLQEIASVRIKYPDVPLKDLGGMLHKSIGKSGVNHRLRKICEIADELKARNKEDSYDNERDHDRT